MKDSAFVFSEKTAGQHEDDKAGVFRIHKSYLQSKNKFLKHY